MAAAPPVFPLTLWKQGNGRRAVPCDCSKREEK